MTDAAVPISQLARVMEATAADVAASNVVGPIFGHAGARPLHLLLASNQPNPSLGSHHPPDASAPVRP